MSKFISPLVIENRQKELLDSFTWDDLNKYHDYLTMSLKDVKIYMHLIDLVINPNLTAYENSKKTYFSVSSPLVYAPYLDRGEYNWKVDYRRLKIKSLLDE
jgi:hypothetical protein